MHLAALSYDFQDMFAHPGCISFARPCDLCEAGRVNVQRLYTDERLTGASNWSIIEFPCRLRQAALGLDDTVDTQAGDDILFGFWRLHDLTTPRRLLVSDHLSSYLFIGTQNVRVSLQVSV